MFLSKLNFQWQISRVWGVLRLFEIANLQRWTYGERETCYIISSAQCSSRRSIQTALLWRIERKVNFWPKEKLKPQPPPPCAILAILVIMHQFIVFKVRFACLFFHTLFRHDAYHYSLVWAYILFWFKLLSFNFVSILKTNK